MLVTKFMVIFAGSILHDAHFAIFGSMFSSTLALQYLHVYANFLLLRVKVKYPEPNLTYYVCNDDDIIIRIEKV